MIQKSQKRTVYCSKSTVYFVLLILIIGEFSCSNQKERPSPLRMDSIQIGETKIGVEFSSPGVKGRDIFGIGSGYLEPYKEIWRTGANKSTSLSFDQDLYFDTALVEKGKYSIFTIPDAKTWEIILNKDSEQWGSSYYQDSLDVLRIRVEVVHYKELHERMKLYFENDSLKFRWEYIGWSIPLANP
jgi:hypothetical protein